MLFESRSVYVTGGRSGTELMVNSDDFIPAIPYSSTHDRGRVMVPSLILIGSVITELPEMV